MPLRNGVSVDIHRSIEDVSMVATDQVAVCGSIIVEGEPVRIAAAGRVGSGYQTVTEDR